jgi:hypothetical protein
MSNEKKPEQTRENKGRWKPGTSGNPQGRPAGSRNKAAVIIESMLEGDAAALAGKLLERTREGDIRAIGMCLDRLAPPRREPTACLSLPVPTTAQEVLDTLGILLQRVAAGEVPPSQAEMLYRILDVQRQVIEGAGFEAQLSLLEKIQRQQPDYVPEEECKPLFYIVTPAMMSQPKEPK